MHRSVSRRVSLALGGLVLVQAAVAQTTRSVHAQDLQAAIWASSPGDVLLVHGTFAAFATPIVVDRPLFIHGSDASVVGNVGISNVGAGASLVLQGFSLGGVTASGCAGRILLADLQVATAGVSNCAEVAMVDVTVGNQFFGGLTVTASTVQVTRGRLTGRSVGGPSPALHADGSTVLVADAQFLGGDGQNISNLPRPGIAMTNSVIRLSGACQVTAGLNSTLPENAVNGTGRLIHSPATVFVPRGGVDVAPTITRSQLDLPRTTVQASAIGGVGTVRLDGNAGEAFALLGLLPGPATTLPGVDGELWLAGPTVIAQGVLDGAGNFTLVFPVPNQPILRAIVFRWQGVTSDGVRIRLAEPATECHR